MGVVAPGEKKIYDSTGTQCTAGGGGGPPPLSQLGCYREETTLEPADCKTGYLGRAVSGPVSIMTELSRFNSLLREK